MINGNIFYSSQMFILGTNLNENKTNFCVPKIAKYKKAVVHSLGCSCKTHLCTNTETSVD